MSRLTGVSLAIWSAFAALIVINVMLVTSNLHMSDPADVDEQPVRSAHVDEGYLSATGSNDATNTRDRRVSTRDTGEDDERYERLAAMLEEQELRYHDLLKRYRLLADYVGLDAQSPDSFEPIELLPIQLSALTRRPAAALDSASPAASETPAASEADAATLMQRIAALETELQLEMQLSNLLQQEVETLRGTRTEATENGDDTGAAAEDGMTDPMLDTETEIADAVGDQLVELGANATPALNELLQHPAPRIREWAANVVTDIGPGAAMTRSALIGLREDPDPYVRAAAGRALMSIDGQGPE